MPVSTEEDSATVYGFEVDRDPVQELLKADEGYRSQVFAVGPGVWYNYKNMFFSLRNQWEMAAKNKTEGYNIWAKFTYAF